MAHFLKPGLPLFLADVSARANPNLIVIIADDLGYGDVSCYGATAFKSPNIDRLVPEVSPRPGP